MTKGINQLIQMKRGVFQQSPHKLAVKHHAGIATLIGRGDNMHLQHLYAVVVT
jgi:hypothetical protein